MRISKEMSRPISRKVVTPPPAPGFIGPGHTAVDVVRSTALQESDPFVLLMDDRLDIAKRRQIGGPHPHAGLETVTFVLEGALFDRDEGELAAGDVVWMSAGRGIVHNEDVETVGRTRILQLWIALRARDRSSAPDFEVVRGRDAPVLRAAGVEARLYSGSSGALRSPTRNRVPVTMMDVSLAPGATFHQDLPTSYNGFLYVLSGKVLVGSATIASGEVGWLGPSTSEDLSVSAGDSGARFVLYAGERIAEPLVHQGPFVAGSREEIVDLHRRFRAGEFDRVSQLTAGHASHA
ncbi:MAG: Pirin-like protein YhhW [Myxococcaceae bacterium]|nr:Pirin-like protein YhhW [Myxococcaceae bacterium]